MKKIVIIAMITIMIMAFTTLDASIFSKGETLAKELNGFLVAISVAIGTAIGIWIQVKRGLAQEAYKKDVARVVAPLIEEAQSNSIQLLSAIKDVPEIDLIKEPNRAKNMLVSAAALQLEPVKAKKAGLGDLVKMGAFVTDIYKMIKPLVKKN